MTVLVGEQPALAAEKQNRPTPPFCPRIRLDLRAHDVDGERMVGTGSLEQVRDDLGGLQELGAQHVILDWFTGEVPGTANHPHGWEMLELLAEQVLDLAHEALR